MFKDKFIFLVIFATILIGLTGFEDAFADVITILDNLDGATGESSLAIGDDGNPIISYNDETNGDLKVVHCTNVSCSTFDSPVTLDSVGSNPSTAIGNDGNPIISYYDGTNDDLKVVHCTNVSCSTFDSPVTLDSSGDVGRFTSIAIGNDSNPIISYYDATNKDLKVVHCTNVSCSTLIDPPFTLDSSGDVGRYPSIAIGSDGNPIISYNTSFQEDQLKIIQCNNASCTSHNSPIILDSGKFLIESYLAIGSDGYPVIGYDIDDSEKLALIHCTNFSCSTHDSPVILDDEQYVGGEISIAIGNDGNPLIGYRGPDVSVRILHCTSVSCSTHENPLTLDRGTADGWNSSLKIGIDGKPIISYFDNFSKDLMVLQCTNPTCDFFENSWTEGMTLDSGQSVGRDTSIAIGTDGNPIISYTDMGNGDLKAVHCTNISCSAFDTPTILDSEGLVGRFTSITIGIDDNPIISFNDYGNDDLKVVHCTNASCSTHDAPITLDSEGLVGEGTSIAIGTDGNPIISYNDSENFFLKVVHCTSADCSSKDTPIILDSSGKVATFTSIAIGSDGNPIISYYDFTEGDLKVVHCTSTNCSSNDGPLIIDSTGDVGNFPSIAIGLDGNPVISYRDETNDNLKFVHCTNPSCSTHDAPLTLDDGINVGVTPSTTIGNDGNPIISYHDVTNRDLKIVHCTNPSCTTHDNPVILDGDGMVGLQTSITIGNNNFPIISYRDSGNNNLKVITQYETCSPNSGTWNIGHDCTVDSSTVAQQDVVVQNNSRLTILPGVTLDIDFENHSLRIISGSSVLVEFGGSIS